MLYNQARLKSIFGMLAAILLLGSPVVLIVFAIPLSRLFASSFTGQAAASQTYIVNSLNDAQDANVGDGLCQTGAAGECTLRAAIDEANVDSASADTIRFDNTLILPGTIALSSDLTIRSALTILGPEAGILTLDAGPTYRHFEIEHVGGLVSISNLTLTNGGGYEGGSVRFANANGTRNGPGVTKVLNLTSLIIRDGDAGYGGAINVDVQDHYTDALILTLSNVTLFNNRAYYGGAIYAQGNNDGGRTVVDIRGSRLEDNRVESSGYGGAIYSSQAVVDIGESVLKGNNASEVGGAVYNEEGQVLIVNTTLSGNSAYSAGGAVYNEGYDTITPTLALVDIRNSTITDNRAGEGGGIYQSVPAPDPAPPIVTPYAEIRIANSILAGNLADDGTATPVPNECVQDGDQGLVTSLGYNITTNANGSDCLFNAPGDQVIQPEQLHTQVISDVLGDNGGLPTYALIADGLAVDGGNPTGCLDSAGAPVATDQRGAPRVGRCDVGAYERLIITVTISAAGNEAQVERTVRATVYAGRSGNLVPVPNMPVEMRVIGGNIASDQGMTNGQGVAVLSYISRAALGELRQAQQAMDSITVWADLDRDGRDDPGEPTFRIDQPSAIELVSFTGQDNGDGSVTLLWQTAVEIDNAGFNLYRATTAAGPFVRINDQLIGAQGNGVGASYQFVDSPPGSGLFVYQLEDVDTHGVSTLHDPPLTVEVGAATGAPLESSIYLPLIQR